MKGKIIMKFEFLNKSVQFAFMNDEKYGEKGKKRVYGHVMNSATGEQLLQVGEAIADLQGDKLGTTVAITKEVVTSKYN